MKMRFKMLAVAGCSSMVVSMVSGCGTSPANMNHTNAEASARPSEETITIAWWGDQTRANKIEQVISLFEKHYPYIHVRAEFVPFSGYFDKLNTELATGTAPDVFALGANINDYADKGVLLNLNPYVGKQLNLSGIAKNLLQFNTFHGKLDGVPSGVNADAILVNTTVFKEAGLPLPTGNWTWDQYASVIREIHKKLPDVYGEYNESNSNDMFGIYLLQRGKLVYNPSTNSPGFSAADATNWFSYWEQLQKSGALVPPDLQVSNAESPGTSLIETGKVAMQFIPANQLSSYQQSSKDSFKLVLIPRYSSNSGLSLGESQIWVGNARTKYPQAVVDWMNFWLNNPQAVEVMGTNIGVPASAAMRAYLEKRATASDRELYEYCDMVAEHSQASKPVYNIVGLNQWSTDLQNVADQVEYGQISPSVAGATLYNDAKQVIASNSNSSGT